jgi:hypothetical protein
VFDAPQIGVYSFDGGKSYNSLRRMSEWRISCPYGGPGSRLWVLTEHKRHRSSDGQCVSVWDENTLEHRFSTGNTSVRVTPEMLGTEWTHMRAIHMPRWAARILVEVTDVAIERVHSISDTDVHSEGFDFLPGPISIHPRNRFIEAWNAVNSKSGFGWDMNPWVWKVTFKNVTPSMAEVAELVHFCSISPAPPSLLLV